MCLLLLLLHLRWLQAVPTTNWFESVAVASLPKITEALKLPEDVLMPTAVLLLPVVLAERELRPKAVLKLPVC
jgi:hypothetical protein